MRLSLTVFIGDSRAPIKNPLRPILPKPCIHAGYLGTVMEEKTAYILAGSFVGFIIERYDLTLFRSLYETGNYEMVYGKPLGMLEKEWRLGLRESEQKPQLQTRSG